MALDNNGGMSFNDINSARDAVRNNPSIKDMTPKNSTERQSFFEMLGFGSRPATSKSATPESPKTAFEARGGAYKSLPKDEVEHATGRSPYGRWATITNPEIKGEIESLEKRLYGDSTYISGDRLVQELQTLEGEVPFEGPNKKIALDIIKKDLKDNNLIK